MREHTMVTPAEAEALAQQHLKEYVAACHCRTTQDIANVLMKMASVAGICMAAAVGQEEAAARLEGTAAYIAKLQPGAARMEKLQ